jgi:hypothetical protein
VPDPRGVMVSAILEGRVRRMPRCLETQPGPRSAWYQPRVAVVLLYAPKVGVIVWRLIVLFRWLGYPLAAAFL